MYTLSNIFIQIFLFYAWIVSLQFINLKKINIYFTAESHVLLITCKHSGTWHPPTSPNLSAWFKVSLPMTKRLKKLKKINNLTKILKPLQSLRVRKIKSYFCPREKKLADNSGLMPNIRVLFGLPWMKSQN